MMDPKRAERLAKIAKWCQDDSGLWDIITASRGPDSPSERDGDEPSVKEVAYRGRRERKHKTVERIRGAAFPGVGSARYRTSGPVILPSDRDKWDHFDGHVKKAALALGLTIEYE